jgi:hypothetical protein
MGFVLNGGLRYRLNEDMQITADYRRFMAGRQKMKGDFGISDNQIDVTGDMFTVGFRLTF